MELDVEVVAVAAGLDLPVRSLMARWGNQFCGSLHCPTWAIGSPATLHTPLIGVGN